MKIKVAIVSGAVREVQFFETHDPEDSLQDTLFAFLMEPALNGPDNSIFSEEDLDDMRDAYRQQIEDATYQHDLLLVEDGDGFYVVSAA